MLFCVCIFLVSLTYVCSHLAFAFVDTVRHISDNLELMYRLVKIIKLVVVAHQIFCWVVTGLL